MPRETFTTREMIDRLIGFDTTSALSNIALIDFVDDYLKSYDIPTRRTANTEGTKANLFATIGPEIAGGVVLSGHTDVVPVTGQNWTNDPFTVIEKDGRLYGRGTSDMKSFSAAALALVPDFVSRPLKKPIHLALSYDEEVGCVGVRDLVADIAANLPRPAMVIIGEPTSMRIVNGHKGISVYETSVTGQAAHSSQPHRGGNAIMAAAMLVDFIRQMAEEKRANAVPDSGYVPPYTTFNVGVINGGTAQNIIAQNCSFQWEHRTLPGDDPAAILAGYQKFATESVLPKLREFAPDAEISNKLLGSVPALTPEEDGDAENLVRLLSGLNSSEVVSFATEGGLFQEIGISTVICGPGSIDQAHQPDEFIELSQVAKCESFLKKLADWAVTA
jgi:acetylornithine deacetylase